LDAAPGDDCDDCAAWECSGKESLSCRSTCTDEKPFCKSDGASCVACNEAADCDETAPVCYANTCVLCEPASTRCSGTTQLRCNAAGTKETPEAILQGVCGAICTPGALRCHSEIGEKCGANGKSYTSNGSDKLCACSDPERFSMLPNGTVKDATTGLSWDFFAQAAPSDTFAAASGACSARSMRLPTIAELKALLLTGAPAAACGQQRLGVDSVAFPAIVNNEWYWTSEPNFEGYLFVVSFNPSSSSSPASTSLLDRRATNAGPFFCVRDAD